MHIIPTRPHVMSRVSRNWENGDLGSLYHATVRSYIDIAIWMASMHHGFELCMSTGRQVYREVSHPASIFGAFLLKDVPGIPRRGLCTVHSIPCDYEDVAK
jgi:hypothetical protein